jgi:hemoglobin/transferrin/lactoferrin receptor protein
MSHPSLAGIAALLIPLASAQDTEERMTRGTLVTATRWELPWLEAPYSTEVAPREEILRRAYRTTPQVLRHMPGVMVQETSVGQGSPFIRGFTGYLNLFLIDGIRLNNSVFRSGPNQYWSTVDPLSIERLEVVKGPSSVLYGSDAVGGTVNAITRGPSRLGSGLGGALYYRGSTAERSSIGRGEVDLGFSDDAGLLVGGSFKSFGDVQGGHDVGRQENTGYDEWDADLKLEQLLGEDTRLVFAYQRVQQDDVPRTHSTVDGISFEGTAVGSDFRRDNDQDRELVYAQLHGEDLHGTLDGYSLSLSFQRQEESTDRIRSNGAREEQGFDVGTYGFFANAASETGIGRVTVGTDLYHDDVSSFSTANSIQGPVADDATYDLVGVFVQDEIDVSERLAVTLGARYNYAAADADSVLDPVSATQIEVEDEWGSLVGSARFLYRLAEEAVHLFGGVSQGFRAPNLSDLTRFDSARSNEFEIPSPDLDPEDYISYELGVKTSSERVVTQVAAFYTDIQDQIVRFPTGNVNGAGNFEVTKSNVGDGYMLGVEAGAAYEVAADWTLFGNATALKGEVDTFPTASSGVSREYVDKLMPLMAQLGVRYDDASDRWWAETLGIWADDADRLSPGDELDTQRIPPGGTPGYVVVDVRGGVRLSRAIDLQLALENVTDEDFRVHGSGSNSPGRNLVFSLVVTP